jgi:uridine kinase
MQSHPFHCADEHPAATHPAPRIVGIAGGSASGKSELAAMMAAQLGDDAAVISQDWYYHDRSALTEDERLKLNFDHPDAFDYTLLRRHLIALKTGSKVVPPRYDYATHARVENHTALAPRRIILLEGLLVLHDPRIRTLLDFSVFINVPAATRLTRRLRRDAGARAIPPEETMRLHHHCVNPMHEQFVQPSASHASTVWDQADDRSFPQRFAKILRAMLRHGVIPAYETAGHAACAA